MHLPLFNPTCLHLTHLPVFSPYVSKRCIFLCSLLYVPTWHISQYTVLNVSKRWIFLCPVLHVFTWHISQYSVLHVSMRCIFHCSVPYEPTRPFNPSCILSIHFPPFSHFYTHLCSFFLNTTLHDTGFSYSKFSSLQVALLLRTCTHFSCFKILVCFCDICSWFSFMGQNGLVTLLHVFTLGSYTSRCTYTLSRYLGFFFIIIHVCSWHGYFTYWMYGILL